MALSVTQTNTAGVTAQACNSRTVSGSSSREASVGGTAGTTAVGSGNQNSGTHFTKIAFSWTPDAGVSWDSGTWTVRLNVTTGNANLTLEDICIRRLNSSNVDQGSIGQVTAQATSGSAGVKSWNITGSSQSPGAGDKVLITITISNQSGSMNQSLSWTPDQDIDSPFSEPTPSDLKIRRRVDGTDTDTLLTLTATDAYYDDGIWTTTRTLLGTAEIGATRVNGDVDDIQVEDAWLQVSYTPAAAITLAADAGSYSITGTAATLLYNREIAADPGSYSITGTAAALAKVIIMAADSGSYSITGQAAALLYHRIFASDSGVYSISGTNAALLYNRVFTSDPGSYAITGQTVTLTKSRILAADSGSYSVSGQTAGLLVARIFIVDPGAYTISGQAASLFKGIVFSAETGSYSITGQATTLSLLKKLVADPGAYSLTGQDAQFINAYIFAVESGQYVITGQAANLTTDQVEVAAGIYIPTFRRRRR